MSTADFDRATFLAMAPGEPGRLERLAAAYEKSTRGTLTLLAVAVEQGNLEQARQLGHKLKSGSLWLGALCLGKIGERLEFLPAEPEDASLAEAHRLHTDAEQHFSRVREHIAATLAALNAS